MADNQIIDIKLEKFNIDKDNIYPHGSAKAFNHHKRFRFRNYIYSATFRFPYRSINETIEFLEQQCFELITSTIIKKITEESLENQKLITINNKSIKFDIDPNNDTSLSS